jgi:glutamine amidotransferase
MCRLAGYVGKTPMPLSALLYEPAHSLEHASYSPRELLSGTVNVDGTGAAWWPEDGSGPLRYVTATPPWADPNLPGLAPSLRGTTLLAAVRSATPGLPYGPDNVAPFVTDGLAGAHNGRIGGFRGSLGRNLLAGLDDDRFGQLTAMNDSLALFLLVVQQVESQAGSSLSDAVTIVIEQTAKAVIAAGEVATLNLVVASSTEIVAARTSVGDAINSLYTRTTVEGSWLASEPLDDDAAWTAAPEHSLAVLTADGVDINAIAHEGVTS